MGRALLRAVTEMSGDRFAHSNGQRLAGTWVLWLASFCIVVLAVPSLVSAETKTITAEAIYIMGDGETPDFAEARVLQKAKQAALEEAGTYVESYTKVQNLDLTTEEIQTVAGGVLQVEILEKRCHLVADGLRFYAKIRAAVTSDRMEELARRIKGRDVAGEYTKLQAEYARLSSEIDAWKQRAESSPPGQKRDDALNQIRNGGQAFERLRQEEVAFFHRLVSGQQLVTQAGQDKDIVDGLVNMIEDGGIIVTVGEVKATGVQGAKDMLAVNVSLTVRASEAMQEAVAQTARKLAGTVRSKVRVWLPYDPQHDPQSLRMGSNNARSGVDVTLVRLGRYRETARYFQDGIMGLGFLLTFEGVKLGNTDAPVRCYLGGKTSWDGDSLEGFLYGTWENEWFPLRRVFPISEVFSSGPLSDRIDNGWYDKFRACEEAEASGKACRFHDHSAHMPTKQDVPGSEGYVAIVRDDAVFVVQHRLHVSLVQKLTGVTVRAFSTAGNAKRDSTIPPCTIVQ